MLAEYATKAAPPGSPRALALLFTPAATRPALTALYGLDVELKETARIVEHAVAHARLDWWQQELERLASGSARHPLTRALAEARREPALLESRLAAAREELAARVPESDQDLERWLGAGRGAIEASAALILELANARGAAIALGRALGLLEVMREMRMDARAGRRRVPESSPVSVTEMAADPWPQEVLTQRARLAERARLALGESRPLAPGGSAARPLLVQAALADRELAALARRHYERGGSGAIEAFGGLIHAWRAARRTGLPREGQPR